MKKNLKLNALLIAILASASAAHAQVTVQGVTIHANTDGTNDSEWLALRAGNGGWGSAGNASASVDVRSTGAVDIQGLSANISAAASINIMGNNDNLTATEGVFIRSNADAASHLYMQTNGNVVLGGSNSMQLNSTNVNVNATALTMNAGAGTAELVVGDNAITSNGTLTQTGTTNITGATTVVGATSITGATTVVGDTSLQGALGVTGNSTTAGITNTGAFNQTGASVITGTTSINSNGTADTQIGTGGGNTTIGAAASVNTITGTANNINGATNITGATTVVGATSVTGATTINTAGAGNTTVGNAANTTTIQSGTNVITGASNSMLSTGANNIQAPLNNIGSNSVSTNNIGTGSLRSTNNIGNAVATTTVTSTAGNASQALANGSASTLVGGGVSGLSNQPTSAQVLLSNAAGTTVDANGKILVQGAQGYVSPTAPTAALTLTNGLGNTHGLVVTESQTTLSGGTQSSSMTLNDRAATFGNAQTGAPITVTGVADGRTDFDAVNVRQFAGAIAAVTAQANIPALAAGQDRAFGLGLGHFMGKTGLAMGLTVRGSANSVYKATVSTGITGRTKQAVVGVGGAWGF